MDCWAAHAKDGRRTLSIQVVRAIAERGFWQTLWRLARITEGRTVRDLAAHLLVAVKKKSVDDRIPLSVRPGLVLALDATRLPVLALDSVAEYFRKQHGSWAASLGFAAIWVVGPVTLLCHRLDE